MSRIKGGSTSSYYGFILAFLLVALVGIGLLFYFRGKKEGFEYEPIQYINTKPVQSDYKITATDIQDGYYVIYDENRVPIQLAQLPYGFYKVDANNMAKVPTGFVIAPQGTDAAVDYMTRIIPKTQSAAAALKPRSIPKNGVIPDGFYKVDDKNMAPLRQDMLPNIEKIDIGGTAHNPIMTEHYGTGFVNKKAFYDKVFTITTPKFPVGPANPTVFPLPPKLYYTPVPTGQPWNHNQVQYLPYGKLANVDSKGILQPGYHDNPGLISKTGMFDYNKNYKDISMNYNVEFHDSIDVLKEQNDMYDISFGSITVLDPCGNLVVLPRSEIQGDITYYRPGTYTFGASTYVPKYEDSVYLSRSTQLPTTSEYRSAQTQLGFCEANKASPTEIEENCKSLDVNACASTSCCVLLGGAKCVSGTDTGPTVKANYGDLFLRNKDYYTHLGNCYGNCP